MHPVAPPIKKIGLKPIIPSLIKFIMGMKLPKWSLSEVGSNPILKMLPL